MLINDFLHYRKCYLSMNFWLAVIVALPLIADAVRRLLGAYIFESHHSVSPKYILLPKISLSHRSLPTTRSLDALTAQRSKPVLSSSALVSAACLAMLADSTVTAVVVEAKWGVAIKLCTDATATIRAPPSPFLVYSQHNRSLCSSTTFLMPNPPPVAVSSHQRSLFPSAQRISQL